MREDTIDATSVMAAVKDDPSSFETEFNQIDAVSLGDTTICYLRENGYFCDVCIVVPENYPEDAIFFNAHKIILVAVSPYFQNLFQKDKLDERVVMPASIKSTAFSLLLSWMYGKDLSPLELREALPPSESVSSLVEDLINVASFLGLYRVASQLSNWTLFNDAGVKEEVEKSNFVDDILLESIKSEEVTVVREDAQSRLMTKGRKNKVQMVVGQRKTRSCKTDSVAKGGKAGKAVVERKPLKKAAKKTVKGIQLTTDVEATVEAADTAVETTVDTALEKKGEESSATVNETVSEDESESPIDDGDFRAGAERSPQAKKANESISDTSGSDCDTVNGCNMLGKGMKDLEVSHFTVSSSVESSEGSDKLREYRDLNKDEVERLFSNPRDRLYIGRKRTIHKLDPVSGNSDSWHRASEQSESFLGKAIPYHNRTARTDKLWNTVKKIKGEIRGGIAGDAIELILETGVVKLSIQRDETDGKASCPFCEVVISRRQSLVADLGYHFLNDHNYLWIDVALICDLCDFIHMSEPRMKDHLHHIHGITADDCHICSKCGRKFATKLRLFAHRGNCKSREMDKKESGNKKYPVQPVICGTCGEKRSSVQSLENHMSKAHDVPYRFPCTQEDCTFGSNTRSQFTDHLFSNHKINVGEKTILQCSFCDFVTTHSATLKKHVAIHTSQEYLFKCPNEGCQSTFRQQRHLQKVESIFRLTDLCHLVHFKYLSIFY